MPRTIEVTVSPRGETTVQTRGYAGGDCLAASKFLEQALGVTTAETQDRRVLPGPGRRAGPAAVAVTPRVSPPLTQGATRCPTTTSRPRP